MKNFIKFPIILAVVIFNISTQASEQMPGMQKQRPMMGGMKCPCPMMEKMQQQCPMMKMNNPTEQTPAKTPQKEIAPEETMPEEAMQPMTEQN